MIECGKVRVQFIAKSNIQSIPTQPLSTLKSILTLSTPEATAMDLLCYPIHCGGLNRIVTELDELREHMNAEKLKILAESQTEIAWKQRLGFLLDKLGSYHLAEILEAHLESKNRVDYIQLMPGLPDDERVGIYLIYGQRSKIICLTHKQSYMYLMNTVNAPIK